MILQVPLTLRVAQDLKRGWRSKRGKSGAALTQTAQQARDQARETASSLASEAQERIQGYMDQQVAAGADLAGRVASAIKTAADELGRSSPMLGDMVRGASEKVDDLSQQFRDKRRTRFLPIRATLFGASRRSCSALLRHWDSWPTAF